MRPFPNFFVTLPRKVKADGHVRSETDYHRILIH
jgi:hypothetical protein